MRIVFQHRAEDDLAEIVRYISSDSKLQSLRVARALREACTGLQRYPNRFPVIKYLEGRAIRRLTWTSYSIVYVVDDRQVSILRILHASRDIDALLANEPET